MSALPYQIEDDGLVLFIRLTPKGGGDQIEGVYLDAQGKTWLKVSVRAVPEDGKANAALQTLLAKRLDVPRSKIALVTGHTARNKQLRITGDITRLQRLLSF